MKKQKAMEMDFNSILTIDFFPYEVVVKIMEALKQAEEKSDLEALKWCAKKILFLYEIADTSEGCISKKGAGKLFMSAYGNDAPPASIAGIVGETE